MRELKEQLLRLVQQWNSSFESASLYDCNTFCAICLNRLRKVISQM